MGRIGNQMEHFLGGLAFAKAIDRTLVLPPFRTFMNVPFTDYYEFSPLTKYHRVITAEDFMQHIAPEVWPPGKRIGFCWTNPHSKEPPNCRMKEGSPFGPFWDGLGVNFDDYVYHTFAYSSPSNWVDNYPATQYPVIALKGAPASFPMKSHHRHLQSYLQFTPTITQPADQYIQQNFPGKTYVGIHLRNGPDWENACSAAAGRAEYMASPQCLDESADSVTQDLCLPSLKIILNTVQHAVNKIGASVVYVATDRHPLVTQLQSQLGPDIDIYHQDPWLPQVDQHVLIQSDLFIGNCVSSFTSYVTRARNVLNKETLFWGLKQS